MAIRTQEELKNALSGILGESPSDEGITLLEDMTDTLASLTGNGTAAYWKQKFEDNDAGWRKRYTDRFNNPISDNNDSGNNPNDKNKPMTFDDLFKEVK